MLVQNVICDVTRDHSFKDLACYRCEGNQTLGGGAFLCLSRFYDEQDDCRRPVRWHRRCFPDTVVNLQENKLRMWVKTTENLCTDFIFAWSCYFCAYDGIAQFRNRERKVQVWVCAAIIDRLRLIVCSSTICIHKEIC